MSTLIQDLKYALRTLSKSPGFTVVAVLSLGLGIGASGAAFSFLDAMRLRALPFHDADRIVAFGEGSPRTPERTWCCAPYKTYLLWKSALKSIDLVAAHVPASTDLLPEDGASVQPVGRQAVSASLFRLFGVRPFLGRLFREEDDRSGAQPVVLIGYELWQSRFNGAPDVLGKPLKMSDGSPTIVGVLPRGFDYEIKDEVWIPLTPFVESRVRRPVSGPEAANPAVSVLGRLAPRATLSQVRAEIAATARDPSLDRRTIPYVRTLRGDMLLFWRSYDVLFGIVALAVLLIAWSNLAGLVLVRTLNRRREVAVRTALGASPAAIVRQLATEGLLVAAAGGTLGTLLCSWAIAAIRASHLALGALGATAQNFESRFDARTLGASFALTVLTGACVGVLPARRAARADPQAALRESTPTASGGRTTNLAQRTFVVAQIACTAVLLALSAGATRMYLEFTSRSVGFDDSRIVYGALSLSEGPPGGRRFPPAEYFVVREKLASIPGVAAVGAQLRPVVDQMGPAGDRSLLTFDRAAGTLEVPVAGVEPLAVDSGFFTALRIPFLRGQTFPPGDEASGAPVAVLNELAARRFFPGEDPIGKRLRFGKAPDASPWITVVGVAGNTKDMDPIAILEDFRPMVFLPAARGRGAWLEMFVRPRSGDARSLIAPVRRALLETTPNKSVTVIIQRELYRFVLDPIRANVLAILGLASCGVFLAAIGIYGVIAYAVGRRTNEIGIRMALGADRASVLGLVFREASLVAALGLTVGLSGAVAAARLMRNAFFGGRGATDPLLFVGVGAVLLVVTFLASALPARRATQIDPLAALRAE